MAYALTCKRSEAVKIEAPLPSDSSQPFSLVGPQGHSSSLPAVATRCARYAISDLSLPVPLSLPLFSLTLSCPFSVCLHLSSCPRSPNRSPGLARSVAWCYFLPPHLGTGRACQMYPHPLQFIPLPSSPRTPLPLSESKRKNTKSSDHDCIDLQLAPGRRGLLGHIMNDVPFHPWQDKNLFYTPHW